MHIKRIAAFTLLCMALVIDSFGQVKFPIKPIKLPQPVDSFTIFPINLAAVKSIIPLGNLNPGGHTFPTDHCYINLNAPSTVTPVLAPGNIKLTNISRSQRFKENTNELIGEDYTLVFTVNATYSIRFDHLGALSPVIANLLTADIEHDCNTYNTGGFTHKQCRLATNLAVSAGTEIGKVGGQAGIAGLDYGASTNGVKPPYGTVCPFGFYKKSVYAQFVSKFGNGIKQRTTPPVCGVVIQDVPNTLKGRWLLQGQPYYPEDPHIAFVDDNIDPAIPAISVGTSQVGLPPKVYTYQKLLVFVATGNADINQPFTSVANNGKTYCFNLFPNGQAPATSNGSLIVKMTSNTTVEVEYRPGCNCSCNKPYTFTDKKVSYTKAGPTGF
jgi:hypothetical protein